MIFFAKDGILLYSYFKDFHTFVFEIKMMPYKN